jgi:hypothetical protein
VRGSQLKELILKSLSKQGFRILDHRIKPPRTFSKTRVRQLHQVAVNHQIEQAKNRLGRIESHLLSRIASGSDVIPADISPRLIRVTRDSDDELLFRYASRHWSVPVSSGYGRRLRYIVVDDSNGKLIGLFGLADPVYALQARDRWIGWDRAHQRTNLRHVMDSFVLGAIAMLVASNEVRRAFKAQYSASSSVISQQPFDGRLALITTTSALGRSSIYNRIKFNSRLLYESVGFTEGSGEFHFANGVYSEMLAYAGRHCDATAKQSEWGLGFRNRREVIKKCLAKIGLSSDLIYHGVKREIFVIPLASNTQDFLSGKTAKPSPLNLPAKDVAAFFKERWLLPRSLRDQRYKEWTADMWRLW